MLHIIYDKQPQNTVQIPEGKGGHMGDEERTWSQRIRVWLRLGIRAAGGGAVLSLLRLLPPLLSMLLPFLLALGLAAALNPLVRRLQRRIGWNRRLLSLISVLSVFSLTGATLSLLVYLAGRELTILIQQWDQLSNTLVKDGGWQIRLERMLPSEITEPASVLAGQLKGWVQEAASELLSAAARRAASAAASFPEFLLGLAVFLIASYFLTAEYPYLRTRALQHMSERVCDFLRQLKRIAAAATGGYLKAQLLLSAGVFFLLLGGFLLWGQEYALLLALGLAVLDFIPLIGAGTVLVPWSLLSVLTGQYESAAWTAALLSVTAAFRHLTEPKIVGDQTGLSPVASLMSIYVGMKLAGVTGMILGPIVTLMVLNLSGLGLFHGLYKDINFMMEDISFLFRRD